MNSTRGRRELGGSSASVPAEVQEKHIIETEAAKQRRADMILSKLEQREQQIAEQLDTRLSRMASLGPATSSRAQQLLAGDTTPSSDRARKLAPIEPGGVFLGGSPRSKRLNPLGRK